MNPREPNVEQTEPETDDLPENVDSGAQGDFRGPYGYGRPAHRPDPSGQYGFEPRAVRLEAGTGGA